MTKKGVDAEKAPTVIAMAEALSERNLGLMGAILALMIRAEAEPLYRQDCIQYDCETHQWKIDSFE